MPATAVTISALSRTGGTVTVTTATPHGLTVGQAAYLQNVTSDTSFQGIYTVATVPDATHFTINQASTQPNATPAASGTVVPAKQWIAETIDSSQGGEINIRVEYWFPVSFGNEMPNGSGSSFSRLTSDETTAINTGRIFVEIDSVQFPNNYTGAQMQAFINQLYTQKLAYRNSTLVIGQFYGFYSDGTPNLGRA